MTTSPFFRLLGELDDGDIEETLSNRMSEIVEALDEHSGKGSLKLTLAFERNKFGRIDVHPKIETKKPGKSLIGAQYDIRPGGQLSLFDAPPESKAAKSGVTIN